MHRPGEVKASSWGGGVETLCEWLSISGREVGSGAQWSKTGILGGELISVMKRARGGDVPPEVQEGESGESCQKGPGWKMSV